MQIDFFGNVFIVQLFGALHLKWKLPVFAYSCVHDVPEQADCCRPLRLYLSRHVWASLA